MNKHQVLGLSILFIFFYSSLVGIAENDPQIGLEPGKILPAFKLPNLDGIEIPLQKLRGRIVIIHLWKCQ